MNKSADDEDETARLPRPRWKWWLWIGLLVPVVVMAAFCVAADFALRSEPDTVFYGENESIDVIEELVDDTTQALPDFAGFTAIDEKMTPHNRDGFGDDNYASFTLRAHLSPDIFNSNAPESVQRDELARSIHQHWEAEGYETSELDGASDEGSRIRAERDDGFTLIFDTSAERMQLTVDTGWVELSPLWHSTGHSTHEWRPDLDHLRHPDSQDE